MIPKSILLNRCLFLVFFCLMFVACNNDSNATKEEPTPPTIGPAPSTSPEVEEPQADIDTTTTDSTSLATDSETERNDEVVAPLETTQPEPVVSTTAGRLGAREIEEARMAIVLHNISLELESQNLVYDGSLGQDCSGIYHKIKNLIQRKISTLGNKSKYSYPAESDRNTRQIAHWYHENGNLVIVKDGRNSSELIRPGSVLFFGRSDKSYNNLTIEKLTNPGNWQYDEATDKGVIYHIATVTEVEKDDAGNVVRYTMMHGRNKKHFASRSGGNYDANEGSSTKKMHAKYPFGNWNQQWVAVANIETVNKGE